MEAKEAHKETDTMLHRMGFCCLWMRDNSGERLYWIQEAAGQFLVAAVPHCLSTTTLMTRMDLSNVLGLNFKVESYFFLEDVVKGLWSCSLNQGRRVSQN